MRYIAKPVLPLWAIQRFVLSKNNIWAAQSRLHYTKEWSCLGPVAIYVETKNPVLRKRATMIYNSNIFQRKFERALLVVTSSATQQVPQKEGRDLM